MTQTFVTILTAHMLGDFVFQCDWMVTRKGNAGVLLLHVAVVTLVSWLLAVLTHHAVCYWLRP